MGEWDRRRHRAAIRQWKGQVHVFSYQGPLCPDSGLNPRYLKISDCLGSHHSAPLTKFSFPRLCSAFLLAKGALTLVPLFNTLLLGSLESLQFGISCEGPGFPVCDSLPGIERFWEASVKALLSGHMDSPNTTQPST